MAGSGIFQPLDQFCSATIVRPWRNEGGETVEPGSVSVSIGGDIGAGGAGGVNFGDDLRHLAPVIFAGNFDVPDFDRNVSLAADAKGFINGLEHRAAFVAHVG